METEISVEEILKETAYLNETTRIGLLELIVKLERRIESLENRCDDYAWALELERDR